MVEFLPRLASEIIAGKMLNLTPRELDNALAAIKRHGYGDFFPEPPEFALIQKDWSEVRDELAKIDLDIYEGYDVMFAFAPKSRVNVRRVALLHPYDTVLYTALVLALREGITASRLRPEENRIFSYRADGADEGVLYHEEPSYRDFREAVVGRVSSTADQYVGITDIADLYHRIYQHI